MRLPLYPIAGLLLLGLHAQPAPHFDVASVKMYSQPFRMPHPKRFGGHFIWSTDLSALLGYAYNMQSWRLSGPIPSSEYLYSVDATTSPTATDDQIRLMLQSLLMERFQLRAHRVTRKNVDGYAVTVVQAGFKMKDDPAIAAGEDPAKADEWATPTAPSPGVAGINVHHATMLAFSEALQQNLQTMVLDQTGLAGKYTFEFRYSTITRRDVLVPDLFNAVKALGLRLDRYKGPVECLVVDHIDRNPAGN